MRGFSPPSTGGYALAEIGMRRPNDGGLDDAWQRVDRAFHLFGIDIEPSGDNEVLAAADNVHITARIDFAETRG